jgi:nicotinate-nucleotide adenylyltransferase
MSRNLRTAPGARIGLLGGSFNPAHEGHLHISRIALSRLRLDQVWWLVSPQNPLKSSTDLASLKKRVERAGKIANDPRIVVSDLEVELGTRYTIDTVTALKRRFPNHRFVWLMGGDNFLQLPQWKNWRGLMRRIAVAVVARPGFTMRARVGRAARMFASAQIDQKLALTLLDLRPPAWVLIEGPLHGASATAIRRLGLWP